MADPVVVPGVEWRPSADVRGLLTSRQAVILHTPVGGFGQNDSYHIYVQADGHSYQRHDLARKSKASVDGNPYSIAIVAADCGPPFAPWTGSNVPDYTPAQIVEIVRITKWICQWAGIPPVPLHDSCITAHKGIGWHRLGIDGNFPDPWPYCGRTAGCQHWSLSVGKACPGTRRITTIVDEIIPAVAGADMAEWTQEQINLMVTWLDRVDNTLVEFRSDPATVGGRVDRIFTATDTLEAQVAIVKDQTDTLEAQVAALHVKIDQLLAGGGGGGGGGTADPAAIAKATLDGMAGRLQS